MEMTAEKKKELWLKRYGFNTNSTTYIYYLDNSYENKEQLKEDGFKFIPELLWHIAEIPSGYEDKCIEVKLEDIGEFAAWGEAYFRPDVKTVINNLVKAARPTTQSNSEYIGEEKERIHNLVCTLVSVKEIETKYGKTQLVTFKEHENVLIWWTTVIIDAEIGSDVTVDFTVKGHQEYNGCRQTVITRAKIK